MQITLLKSKILRATVTDAHVDYEGSLAIDKGFMDVIGLLPYEKILVGNITGGQRLETYAIPAPSGSKTFSLNGAAAHRGKIGDVIVIMSFCQVTPEEAADWEPSVLVLADGNSRIASIRNPQAEETTREEA